VIVDCAHYRSGIRIPGVLNLANAFEVGRSPESFVWIGLFEPTEAEFEAVQKELGLHPLAVEDAMHAHQRPKVDRFDDSVFVVFKTASYDDQAESITIGEIHVFIANGFVVTVRHGDLAGLADLRVDLERNPSRLALGPGVVLHAIADRVADEYQQVMNGVENDIDEVEREVFSTERKNMAERIFRLKRQVLEFQRASVPLPDVLDHVLRVCGRVETARDTLGSALEANLAQVSVRQNEDMRAISGWAATIAVPTLLAGIWGMNFSQMPELSWKFGYPVALLTIVGSAGLVYSRLRKNGWL
jgi:magnesium transporter